MRTGPSYQAQRHKTIRLVFALCALLHTFCISAEAEQAGKIPRIGYIAGPSRSGISSRTEAFQQGLRELGYIEGKSISIEYRYADGKLDRLPKLAAELVSLKVELIVSGGPTPTRAAKEATAKIPIVMTQDTDPVAAGFVASLAQPGGNITGLSTYYPEISGKQLELLKEIVPNLGRIAMFGSSINPGTAQAIKEAELAAGALGLKLQYLDVLVPKDIENAFLTAKKGKADAALFLSSGVVAGHRKQLAESAIKNRLAAIYWRSEFVTEGGLMSYGVRFNELDRRAATYVDKILRGAKPGDLPVEQPTKFEFVVNLKAAKQIGLSIPPNVLARADRVIR